MGIKSMFRNHTGIADSYLIHPKEWSDPNANINGHFFNNIFFLGWQNIYNNPLRYGQSDLLMRSSVFSNYDFSTLTFTQVNNERMDLLTLRTRLFAQWAYGSNIPVESMLYLAGANGEEMSENPFTRASGIFPQSLGGYGLNTSHFHYGGGLNIRGYAGYVAAYTASNGQVIATYRGHSGASVNTELEFDKLLKIKPPYISNFLKMHTYIFADAGFISANNISDRLELSHLRASAGAGFALTIRNFGPFTKLKPLTLRCDIPFFLNRPPAIDNDFVKLRWIVGLKRAF